MVSHNLSTPDGTQHSQRKQMEVLQTRTASGGALQVVRAQTVQTSSSRWSSNSHTNSSFSNGNSFIGNHSSGISLKSLTVSLTVF
jgi:hypothetical protein